MGGRLLSVLLWVLTGAGAFWLGSFVARLG
jgi:hypothetical protein